MKTSGQNGKWDSTNRHPQSPRHIVGNMGVSIVMGVPPNGWCVMKNPSFTDDLGVPSFQETSTLFWVVTGCFTSCFNLPNHPHICPGRNPKIRLILWMEESLHQLVDPIIFLCFIITFIVPNWCRMVCPSTVYPKKEISQKHFESSWFCMKCDTSPASNELEHHVFIYESFISMGVPQII